MKCVQDTDTLEIIRITDEEAASFIPPGKAEHGLLRYVPKSLYKAQQNALKAKEGA